MNESIIVILFSHLTDMFVSRALSSHFTFPHTVWSFLLVLFLTLQLDLFETLIGSEIYVYVGIYLLLLCFSILSFFQIRFWRTIYVNIKNETFSHLIKYVYFLCTHFTIYISSYGLLFPTGHVQNNVNEIICDFDWLAHVVYV